MWYHCLPSGAIIFVSASIPYIVVYLHNKYVLGNPYKRYISNSYQTHMYLRDMRLGDGDPYKQLGLDCLPEDESL